jgi:opacity protein-like surface antigen
MEKSEMKHSMCMTSLVGVMALSSLSTAALARDGWYLGAGIGPNFKESENFSGSNGSFTADFSDDAVYAVSLGYAMPSGWRPEFAIDARSNNVSSLSSNGSSSTDVSGHEDADTFMFNIWYDFQLGNPYRRLHPYLGGGVGFAQVAMHDISLSAFEPYVAVDDTQTLLAYQFGLGASYDLAPNWKLLAEFRYLASDSGNFKYTAPPPVQGGTVNAGYSAESVMFGFRYEFGRDLFR